MVVDSDLKLVFLILDIVSPFYRRSSVVTPSPILLDIFFSFSFCLLKLNTESASYGPLISGGISVYALSSV